MILHTHKLVMVYVLIEESSNRTERALNQPTFLYASFFFGFHGNLDVPKKCK